MLRFYNFHNLLYAIKERPPRSRNADLENCTENSKKAKKAVDFVAVLWYTIRDH